MNSKKRMWQRVFCGAMAFIVIAALTAFYGHAFHMRKVHTENYLQAQECMSDGNYETALQHLQTIGPNWRDSSELIEECEKHIQYQEAVELYESGQYEEAIDAFCVFGAFEDSELYIAKSHLLNIGNYQEQVYNAAIKLIGEQRYEEALKELAVIPDYRDAAEILGVCQGQTADSVNTPVFPRDESGLELPIDGATGYGIIDLNLREADKSSSGLLKVVPAGTPFRILDEGESYFYVMLPDGSKGYASKTYTMLNLPDVVPSIVYDATNAYDSRYRSVGFELEGVTGETLYTGKTMNARLGYEEYMMPVTYGMAKKVAAAQAAALADGNTLVLYEGFRPSAVQVLVRDKLKELGNKNPEVNAAIIKNPTWNISWFIAMGTSNHQKGYAIDVSLAKVEELAPIEIDGTTILKPVSWTEYEMPTPIHELSPAAKTFAYPISSSDDVGWRKTPLANSFNDTARALQQYCTNAGMTPLASEWWHFNDLESRKAQGNQGLGLFEITSVMSVAPSEIGQ